MLDPSSPQSPQSSQEGFDTLGFNSELRRQLAGKGWNAPRDIQHEAIPQILAGKDVIGLAQTGSGKTGAFGLPILHRLSDPHMAGGVRALVLSPARELAEQIWKELGSLVGDSNIQVHCFIGGIESRVRIDPRVASIVVGTPGRMFDLIVRKGILPMKDLKYLVIDEFDQVLSQGMAFEVKKIAELTPRTRQTLLFSATMPSTVQEKAAALVSQDAVRVGIEHAVIPSQIEHHAYRVQDMPEKFRLLVSLLQSGEHDSAMIFVRNKWWTGAVRDQIAKLGFSVAHISSAITNQAQRSQNLQRFLDGRVNFLVATDVAGRGIDYPGSPCVINFDFPLNPADYVHRAGRTGRAGRPGKVITFVGPTHERAIQDLITEHALEVQFFPLPKLPSVPIPRRNFH